jgi:pimeloyl-ACP methyl ester carboxylesterase
MKHMAALLRIFFVTLISFSLVSGIDNFVWSDELPRRISLGTQLQPVTEETKERLGLKNLNGAQVTSVIPNSTAEAAGIKSGDVLLAVGNKRIASIPAVVEHLATLRGGDELVLKINRDGNPVELKTFAKELDRETSVEFEIEYGSVTAPVGKLRTVLSLPKNATKHRAILLLGGLGNAFVEHPVADPTGAKNIAYQLTKRGFAVLRVDKPGCGDSEGGPARDVDFQSVVDGYIAALRQLKNDPRIDSNHVYLFGVSMGGVQAPLVAAAESVRGIGIFGAMSMNWLEYIEGTAKRQLKLGGVTDADITEALKVQTAGWRAILEEGLSPDDLFSKANGLGDWSEQVWQEGQYFSGITYKFFQQLAKSNIEAAWAKFDGPVISMWGEMDFVTSKEDHQKVADVVNAKSPSNATFVAIPNVDHNLREASSIDDALKQTGVALSPAVMDAYAKWIEKLSSN